MHFALLMLSLSLAIEVNTIYVPDELIYGLFFNKSMIARNDKEFMRFVIDVGGEVLIDRIKKYNYLHIFSGVDALFYVHVIF
jgi:hypothetical protein